MESVSTTTIQETNTTSIQNIPPTATPSEVLIPTISQTYTNTIEEIEMEKPLIYLINHSGDGPSGDDVCLRWKDKYYLAIYDNGRAIKYYSGIGLFESHLETREIASLLNWIQNTGYFENTGNGDLSENDPIYKMPPVKNFNGGPFIEIKVKEKIVRIYNIFLEYLIYPIKQTYNILNNYQLLNKNPFIPKKIALFVFDKEYSPYVINPNIEPIIWPKHLHQLYGDYYYNYEGNDLKEILSLFGEYYPIIKPVIYNDKEYHVLVCPRLDE
jgi:hypothetical protein